MVLILLLVFTFCLRKYLKIEFTPLLSESMEMFVHGKISLHARMEIHQRDGGSGSFYCLRAVDRLAESFKGIFQPHRQLAASKRAEKNASHMCQSQQTCIAAVLGSDGDYHKTQLQGFACRKRHPSLSRDHFVGDGSNDASLLLVVIMAHGVQNWC